jgi:ubiquinone biosynthesis protein
MRVLSLCYRFLRAFLLVQVALVSFAFARLFAMRKSKEEKLHLLGTHLARLLERLGATYVKFGQILSTRPDVLPEPVVHALSTLQDKVRAEPFSKMRPVLRAELGEEGLRALGTLDETPVAAASVAQVYRAVMPDGTVVAVKVQRPDVEENVERDLTLLMIFARMLNVFPTLELLSIPGAVARFGEAMRGQLDFRDEAENNRIFATNFADSDFVSVPRLIDGLSTRRVLVMAFVEGVRATDPEKVGAHRDRIAKAGLDAILRMVFKDAFVHADMHPGNIILTKDGGVVLIDLGLVARIPDDMRRPFIETFVAMSQYDGEGAARLFYGHAPAVGTRDYPTFERELTAHFESMRGKPLGEMEASEVLAKTMEILRRHRIQVDPVFTVVNLAMLVAEGLGKQLDPTLDIVEVAMPYLAEAMMTAPEGRPFVRQPPLAA